MEHLFFCTAMGGLPNRGLLARSILPYFRDHLFSRQSTLPINFHPLTHCRRVIPLRLGEGQDRDLFHQSPPGLGSLSPLDGLRNERVGLDVACQHALRIQADVSVEGRKHRQGNRQVDQRGAVTNGRGLPAGL